MMLLTEQGKGAKKTIELINRFTNDICEVLGEAHNKNRIRQAVLDAIADVLDEDLKLAEPTAKENLVVDWIPVTERLPDEMGMYLVTLDYQEKGKGVVSLWFHNDEIGWNRGWNENVTAWMPLPKPYKEGEEA